MTCEAHEKISERVTRVEESSKSAHKRIDSMEEMQKDIRDLTISIGSIADSVKRLVDDMTEIKCRVTSIEGKPGKRWDLIVTTVITCIIGGIIGYMLGVIF